MVHIPTWLVEKVKALKRKNHKVGKTGEMMFYKKKTQALKRKRMEIEKKAAKKEVVDDKVFLPPDN